MTIEIDGNSYDAITFDCYGTLIDWEAGLTHFLQPLLLAHDCHAVDGFLLEFFGRTEAALQAGPYRKYRTVLTAVLAALGERLGFRPSPQALENFPKSIGDWSPFPDTVPALKMLAARYRLVVISNIDDDLFFLTQARLGINFDHVITAAQVGAYKPDLRVFKTAMQRIAVPHGRILHVAQSLYHDIAPANTLGLDTVWIDRHDGHGGGATPTGQATPTWTLRSLSELVAALKVVEST
jgi:2-haloacid dehalogenase